MAEKGRKRVSRRQRRRFGLARERKSASASQVVERVMLEAKRGADAVPVETPTAAPSNVEVQRQAEPLGDLSYVPRDIRWIAVLATAMFVLLAVAAVLLR